MTMNYPTHSSGALDRVPPAPQGRPPSLEERLDHLQRGVERLCKLRSGLEVIADRISLVPEAPGTPGGIAPTPSDLSGRFGDTVNHLHNNLDTLERLAERIYFGLFSGKEAQPAGRS
jgi:hypothetical protein